MSSVSRALGPATTEEGDVLGRLREVGLDNGRLGIVPVADVVLPEKLGPRVAERLARQVLLDERRPDLQGR